MMPEFRSGAKLSRHRLDDLLVDGAEDAGAVAPNISIRTASRTSGTW
jgi:hypothetical protein